MPERENRPAGRLARDASPTPAFSLQSGGPIGTEGPAVTSTLGLFSTGQRSLSPATAWYLSDLGEFRGKQELYTRQSPQRLKALREHALIESAVSSNRIEGVSVEPSRVRDVLVSPQPLFRDREEEELRGYRDALTWIHQDAATISISDQTIRRLHAMMRGQIWDAGQDRRLHRPRTWSALAEERVIDLNECNKECSEPCLPS